MAMRNRSTPANPGQVSVSSKLSYTKVKAKSFSSLNKIQVFKYWMEIIFFSLENKKKKETKTTFSLVK